MLMEMELCDVDETESTPHAEDWRRRLADVVRRVRPWIPSAPHWPLWVADCAKANRIVGELEAGVAHLSMLLDIEAEPVEPGDHGKIAEIDCAVGRIEELAREIDRELRQSAISTTPNLF